LNFCFFWFKPKEVNRKDFLIRLLIPFHCLFVFVICSAIASRQTRLSGFADSFKKKQKDEAKGHNSNARRFHRCTRISLFRHPAPGTAQSLKPPISPGLRKRRRLKILNKYPFKNSSVRVAAKTYHRRQIFISARNPTKWFDDQRESNPTKWFDERRESIR